MLRSLVNHPDGGGGRRALTEDPTSAGACIFALNYPWPSLSVTCPPSGERDEHFPQIPWTCTIMNLCGE